jgi:predicted flap endonuclease-1-like 5' DNA nuclease
MANNFQKIDGVGKAREESLINEGYKQFEDIAQALRGIREIEDEVNNQRRELLF